MSAVPMTIPWYSYWSQVAQIVTPLIAIAGFWFIKRQIKVAEEQAKAGKDASNAARRAAEAAREQSALLREQVVLLKTQLEDAKGSAKEAIERQESTRRGSILPVCVPERLYESIPGNGLLRQQFRVRNVGLGPACALIALFEEVDLHGMGKGEGKCVNIADALQPGGECIFWGPPVSRRYVLRLCFDNAYGEHYQQEWEVNTPCPLEERAIRKKQRLGLKSDPPDLTRFHESADPDP